MAESRTLNHHADQFPLMNLLEILEEYIAHERDYRYGMMLNPRKIQRRWKVVSGQLSMTTLLKFRLRSVQSTQEATYH